MTTLNRRYKEFGKGIIRRVFVLGQRFGVDILPRHFYSEIPDIRQLKAETDWRKPYTMRGVAGSKLDRQLDFVAECCPEHLVARQKRGDIFQYACRRNGEPGFGRVEADFLYCFIASKRPSRVIQVGSGVSTAVIQLAAEEVGYQPEIICIDPYPTEFLRQQQRRKKIHLIAEKAQRVDRAIFTGLDDQGLLFVDSTHTLQPGGEVPRIVLEILPRLRSNSWVHFHDISFPYDYPSRILTTALFFPHESVLLHAFLVNNDRYEICASLAMLHHGSAEGLQRYLPNYRPAIHEDGLRLSHDGDTPSSIYLRAVK